MPRRSQTNRCRRAGPAMVALAISAAPCFAHDLGVTTTLITLGDRRVEILMQCDLDALALGAGPGADDAALAAALQAMNDVQLEDAIDGLRRLFARRVRLLAGDARVALEVEFPDRDAGRTLGMVPPTFLGLTARLRGSLPADPGELRFRLSRAFPAAQLTVTAANGAVVLEESVPRGETSSAFAAGAAAAGVAARRPSMRAAVAWLLVLALAAGCVTIAARRSRRD